MLRDGIRTNGEELRLGVHDGRPDDKKQVGLKPNETWQEAAELESGEDSWTRKSGLEGGSLCGAGICWQGSWAAGAAVAAWRGCKWRYGWHGEERLVAGPKLSQGEGERGRKGAGGEKTRKKRCREFFSAWLFSTPQISFQAWRKPLPFTSLCLPSQCPRVLENWVELCEGG